MHQLRHLKIEALNLLNVDHQRPRYLSCLTSALDEIHNLKLQIEKVCESGDETQENELQGISEENDNLNMKLEKSLAIQREQEVENELKNLVKDVKEHLMNNFTVATLKQAAAAAAATDGDKPV
ncbi:Replicase polyprotein 1a [Bienertia sinuspersici]